MGRGGHEAGADSSSRRLRSGCRVTAGASPRVIERARYGSRTMICGDSHSLNRQSNRRAVGLIGRGDARWILRISACNRDFTRGALAALLEVTDMAQALCPDTHLETPMLLLAPALVSGSRAARGA
ncbi:hypothetical protein WOLCODRAFT_153959 [Wolfiporia cocos MD-104 SS10]|uniref:Uncharacterized protein n=1 Tax=Wolfiporia cocos (strain MD-104) TaxID=742152 RepID=A0A2H3K646_WOLCO|nr:hypothetical protein WOLCODRAFT_153959 [Wolfiporia cocos MD-104 SS10]